MLSLSILLAFAFIVSWLAYRTLSKRYKDVSQDTLSRYLPSAEDKMMMKITPLLGMARWVILGITVLAFLFASTAIVDNGMVGVVKTFGQVGEETLDPGVHIINPFSEVIEISTQTRELKEEMTVPTKEGLSVELEASVLWHVDAKSAARLYRTVGENFGQILIEPNFRSETRSMTAKHESRSLYTADRDQIQVQLTEALQKILQPRGIFIESTPLRKIELPGLVKDAIATKVAAEQEAQKMEFILLREKQEAERKIVEARGDSVAQSIIASTISDRYLKLKGLEATVNLAKSPNSKIVVVDSRSGSLLINADK